MRIRLNQHMVDRPPAPPPGKRQHLIWDTAHRYFGLCVSRTGVKSFIFQKKRRIVIGHYPAMSLTAALTEYRRLLGEIARGADPAADRAARRAEITLGEFIVVYAEYMTKKKRDQSNHREQAVPTAYRYLPPAWLTRKLSSFTRGEVVVLHASIGANNGRYAANGFVRVLRAMFNRAVVLGYLPEGAPNPAKLPPGEFFREEKRDRFLSPAEVQRLSIALQEEPNVYWRAYFPLSLLLGTRRNELLSARWEHFDFDESSGAVLVIPTTKAGRPHRLPLPAAAVGILYSLPNRGPVGWVFPGIGTTGHLREPKKAWKRLCARADLADVRIHDLRRTLGSWMAARGYSLPLIGKALNHSNVSTTAIYARLDLDPVRAALEETATAFLAAMDPGRER